MSRNVGAHWGIGPGRQRWGRTAWAIAGMTALLAWAWPAQAAVLSQETVPVAPGVSHTAMTTDSPGYNQAIHILRIDRNNPYIAFRAAIALGQVEGKETVTGQAARVTRPEAPVVAGINGDFFQPDGSPFGIHIEDGEIVLSPNSFPVFGIKADGQPILGYPVLSGWVAILNEAGQEEYTSFFNTVNRPRASGSLVLYTPRYGLVTPTDNLGTEVVVQGITGPIKANTPYTGVVVEKRVNQGRTVIPRDGVVLSGSGYGQLFLHNVDEGDRITFKLELRPPFDDVVQAVAGPRLLVQDGRRAALSTTDDFNTARHPRTAIGFNDEQIFFVTVDGRQPRYADGMNLFELADLMIELGAKEAINLDGGGSTTFVVRRPGDAFISIANRPSDGYERSVGNSLLVVSTAPRGELARLQLAPTAVTAYVGSRVRFAVKGQDQYYGPAEVPEEALQWTVQGDAGTIGADGTFVAAHPGSATVTAAVGNATGTAQVTVVDQISRLSIWPDVTVADIGDTVSFSVTAQDAAGKTVVVSPELLRWTIDGSAAALESPGSVRVTANGEATLRVQLGAVTAEARITAGKPPALLWGFDEVGDWRAASARAVASYDIAGRPAEPVRWGTHSGKLTYDFTGQTGTSAAYVQLARHIPIEGRPLKLGLWVYGDGKGHWLRANYYDGKGTLKVTDFTPSGGLTWTGWRYVEAPIDPNVELPLRFYRIYVVETNNQKKDRGVLYFDNLMAIYSDVPLDTRGPAVTDWAPADGSTVVEARPVIQATLRDEEGGSGVEPQSVVMSLDGFPVQAAFDAETGVVTYTPSEPLAPGRHRVRVDAADRAGNPAAPAAEWWFVVAPSDSGAAAEGDSE